MKRVHLRKDRFVSCSYQATVDTGLERSELGQSELESSEVASLASKRRARTSAAMIGLALSMGATGALLPRQDDGAAAAEPRVPNTTLTATLPVAQAGSPFSNVQWVEHIVREGQTLQQVAAYYQVNGWSVAVANGLTPDASLRTGQVLRVPVPNHVYERTIAASSSSSTLVASAGLEQLSDLGSSESTNQLEVARNQSLEQLRQQRERLRESLAELRYEESSVVASAPNVEGEAIQVNKAEPAGSVGVQVQSAENNGIDRIAANHLNSAVQPQSSTLPGIPFIAPDNSQSDDQAAATASEYQVETVQPTVAGQSLVYRVNPGDTVARIARAHNIPQSLLVEVNGLHNPNVIFVGQVLSVPSAQPIDRVVVPETSSSSFTLADASSVSSDSVTPQTDASGQYAPVRELTSLGSPSSTQPDSIVAASPIAASSPGIAGEEPIDETQIAASPNMAPLPEALAPVGGADLAPSISETGLPASANPYVASLLTEIRAMRQQQLVAAANSTVERTLRESTAAVAPTVPQSDSATAISPHMNQAVDEDIRPVNTALPEQNAPEQPEMVAAAPLGSESYDPILQPMTGRMVSPELPPLPEADTFLPEDGVFTGFIWPARGILTSGYGWRWGRMHRGIDIAADVGTPIYAAAAGVIEFAGWNSGGYGNMVEVRHSDGSMTRYAHMNAIHVRNGQRVSQGEQIGEMGSTGYSTGPHLHFEVHIPDQGTVNPMAYLPSR